MAIDSLKRSLLLLAFCLAQALVLNHIHLFGYATPLLYVYFVILFPRNSPKWAILLWSFVLGLAVDMFSNTPGVAASSMTLVGFLQPMLLEPFVPRDSIENLPVSVRSLGLAKFFTFSLMLVTIYCLMFFTIEAFNFFNWQHYLLCIGGSIILTMILLMTLESVRKE